MERKQNYNQDQNQNQQRSNHNSNSSSSSSHDRSRNSLWINRNDPDRNPSINDIMNSVRNRMLNSIAIPENLTSPRDLLNPELNRGLCVEIQETIAAKLHPDDGNRMRNVEIRENLIEQRDHVSEWVMTTGRCDDLRQLLAAEDGGELRETILEIVAADLPTLMVHEIGARFVKALFLACNEHQMDTVLKSVLVGKEEVFLGICNNYYGSECVKVLIHNLKIERQLTIITNVLEAHISFFTNYIHRRKVLGFFIYTFDDNNNRMRLFNAMANQCLDIATNNLGYKVLQCSICPISMNIGLVSSLLDAIVINVRVLAKDKFGSNVIQHVIDTNIEGVTQRIVGGLMGRFCDTAKCQFGSNVVMKCLEKCEQRELVMIVEEFTNSSQLLPIIAQDYFGHNVLLCALEHVYYRGTIEHFNNLARSIDHNAPTLERQFYWKKVVEKIDELNRESPFQTPQ